MQSPDPPSADRNSPPQGESVPMPLEREEYVEQAHFFTVLGRRLKENLPAQEVLGSIREEILATTKLPMAIDFLLAELRHQGILAAGMKQLAHYFTPFQCYVMSEAENDRRRFDLRVALEILAREAQYRTETISRQGLFLYHFEALCRNRLGYDAGLEAVAHDPSYDEGWREWILTVRRQIGIVELADLVYVRSEYYRQSVSDSLGTSRTDATANPELANEPPPAAGLSQEGAEDKPVLFGHREGRIAWANRKKDPLLLFSALHRQLGYPQVPRPEPPNPQERLLPSLARRMEQMEARLKLVEEEQRDGIHLEQFYTEQPPKTES